MRNLFASFAFISVFLLSLCGALAASASSAPSTSRPPPVVVSEDTNTFTLNNGWVIARIARRTGTLISLRYEGCELIAQEGSGANGGYWSSVGRGRPGSQHSGSIRIDPSTNGGERAEVSCRLSNDPQAPDASVDADYRYSLGRGEHWLYVYALLKHKPGYPSFGVGEARYCLKLNPDVFDYLYIDAQRHRVMPTPYDWDHGSPLNLKEARRMTTGIHKGEPEHKYDYSAFFAETPAYGWLSTAHRLGLWIINPSMEYLGGGPTKAELTGHLDVNPGGLPTLLNMWVGSHYGGTTISVATNENWTKFVGPFLLYCNAAAFQGREKTVQRAREALWHDALERAAKEAQRWPYDWVADANYPEAAQRGTVTGRLILHDEFAPATKMSNVWVGVTAPDYVPPPRFGFGGFRRSFTNTFAGAMRGPNTNTGFGSFRGGFPPYVDWQRDAKFYQFWTRADASGRFNIPHVRPGSYTLHAIADGVLGEFTKTNVVVSSPGTQSLGEMVWQPAHFGHPVWQIGVADRTAREFRHGDHYWQWGLYFDYPKEFPNDVNFVVGKSNPRRDWNYVQPPRIESRNVPVTGEDEEQSDSGPERNRLASQNIRSSNWSIKFEMPAASHGRAVLRLAFCGTHMGTDVEVFVNGKSVGDTGVLPSTSAMQRDGISGYWLEKDISFDAALLVRGANTIQLLSHAHSWSQGVMYDCVRLEVNEETAAIATQ